VCHFDFLGQSWCREPIKESDSTRTVKSITSQESPVYVKVAEGQILAVLLVPSKGNCIHCITAG